MTITRASVWLTVSGAMALACGSSGGGGGVCPDGGPCGATGDVGYGGVGNAPSGGGVGNAPGGGGFGNAPGGGGFGNAPGGGGFGNTGGTGGLSTKLGAACVTDAECGNGLSCFEVTVTNFDGQGPGKGYCSVDCASDETVCGQFDPSSVCVSFENSQAYCFRGCSFGPDNLTAFDPKKCFGRPEVACRPFYDESGTFSVAACFPQCNSNADCGSKYCDPETGLCGSTPPTGLALGEPCTPPATGGVDPCKGYCTTLQKSNGQTLTSMCTQGCTTGATPACGWSGTGPAPAACLFTTAAVIDNGGPGMGDFGSCGPMCDCNSQCKASGLVCRAWTGANASQLASYFSRKGYCSDPAEDDGGLNPGIPSCN